MKRFKFSKVIVLLLSIALLMGSVVAVTASAADESTGKFSSITLAYSEKVAIIVTVDATQEEIENGTVVVNYEVEGKELATAEFYDIAKDGKARVITSGFSPFEFADIVTFSSSVNGVQVESGRTYSVAQFLYKMLYTNSGISAEYRTFYESLVAYSEAAHIAFNKTNRIITDSTIAFSDNSNIKFNGKTSAFAPGMKLENLAPTWKGNVPAGKEVSGWVIVENGETKTVGTEFTCSGIVEVLEPVFTIKDIPPYTLTNGDFANGLEGWTLTNTQGDASFGGIDNKTTFWDQNYPMFNVGSYFSAYADGAAEASQGKLESSLFTVGSQYATYMLGGAGNDDVYITIENAAGDVLALYRNTKFADFVEGQGTVGETVFLANFVTYKVDLSKWMGQEVRFVVHDYASENWGVVFFDEVITYYTETDALPENAVLAENLLADKSDLMAELALEVAEQGDYTADTYEAYLAKLAEAKALVEPVNVKQADVDAAAKALTAARLALTVREVAEVEGANTRFQVVLGDSKEINVADYVNTNGLSGITYSAKVGGQDVEVANGKFNVMTDNAGVLPVSITVYYNGVEKLTVELSIEVTNDIAPVLKNESVTNKVDLYEAANKNNITLNFADNIDNSGELALTYAVKHNGSDVALDGTSYTFAFGKYTDAFTYETFTVTVSYVANGKAGTLEYTYTLAINDSTVCRLTNGDFESGMDGWIVVGNVGNVSGEKEYWNGAFGMDGEKMFSAYAPGATEDAVGTLTSSSFKVGGSGWITFKLGGARDANYVYVDVVDASTKQILARYYNGLWKENETHCTLVAYKADLSAFMGKEVFFRISDNADSGYGLFFLDSFVTYYETEPSGFNAATHVSYALPGTIYDVFNGGFEMGDVQGWWNVGEPGKVTGADAFFSGVAYGKDGNFLYSGVEDHGAGNGREGNMGTLTSSVFQIGGNGYITFMLGGGNGLCHVQVIDAVTGEVLARYRQQERQDAVLKTYVADLSAYIGRTVRIQLVDNARNDWGCVSFDNVVTYYTYIPDGITAKDVKYEIVNGSFESGMDGWRQDITEAGAHNTLGWVESNEMWTPEHDRWYTQNTDTKDGNNLFTFCRPDGTNCENTKGTLNSSVFTLKQGTFVAFKFGAAGTRDVRIELVRADGEVIATFYNEAPGKVNTLMNSYFYQYNGETTDCYFRVVDYSTSNYGCFVVDDFRVNLESSPEGYIAVIQ